MQSTTPNTNPIQCLLSLPPSNAHLFSGNGNWETEYFSTCDPPGPKLGSGGGTAHLLTEAWRATGDGLAFRFWLACSRKLMIHGGGQSRRLPAYASVGKPLIPIPVMQWSHGQKLDQNLMDLQVEAYRRVLQHAPISFVTMVTSGDVLLRFGSDLPPFPEVDVLALGMRVDPETASHFGVLFSPPGQPGHLSFFLQKPSPERIREHSATHTFLVDTGMWLLSERAVLALLERCGWDSSRDAFNDGSPSAYELYSQFGLALGDQPQAPDPLIPSLTCAVLALPYPEFYHLGTSRQLIESVWALQNRESHGSVVANARAYPNQIVQNSVFDPPTRRDYNHTLWIENATVPSSWKLSHSHIITGVPDNAWELDLEPGICLDVTPVRNTSHESDPMDDQVFCIRPYGIDDAFSGVIGNDETIWMGRPAAHWLIARGIDWEMAGFGAETDIYKASLFPIVKLSEMDSSHVQWLTASHPEQSAELSSWWCALPRLSAETINRRACLSRQEKQRTRNRLKSLNKLHSNSNSNIFYRLNLDDAARIYAACGDGISSESLPFALPPIPQNGQAGMMPRVYEHMYRAAIMRHRDQSDWSAEEQKAFSCLRESIIECVRIKPARPVCTIQTDQIVWGRSPARLDFAGGWTDTPPYCLQHGGKIANIAVNLNGQPPIQVFVKPTPRRELVIRSIDLGVEERIQTYEQLDTYARPGSEFALAKAALAMAGFLPAFHEGSGFAILDQQLADFGSGLEISLLAAIPAGSGLGTSSILAATLLQSLSDICGLHWTTHDIICRTMALEQMLTTGGGWQDQVGGVLRGVKLAETAPGLDQTPIIRWLPEYLFSEQYANKTILLYYTGITRLAKNILQEIVRGMFLNDTERLAILKEIGDNALFTADAIQRGDWPTLCEAVRRSWSLNQRLDSGTNPPAVQEILKSVRDYIAATKLLGAGGGGYMLILAKDEQAGQRIRGTLTDCPPNEKARFVSLAISGTGLEVTRS